MLEKERKNLSYELEQQARNLENIAPQFVIITKQKTGLPFLLNALTVDEEGNIDVETIKEALNHPNWSMGQKITIDSATMTNKLFELIEAKWLFDTIKCDAIIETKSIIHSMINFIDGITTAHIAHSDMRLPIAFALLGEVKEEIVRHIDFGSIASLEFRQIDATRYPVWRLKEEFIANPDLGVVINTTNEVMINKFLNKQASFGDISKNILKMVLVVDS